MIATLFNLSDCDWDNCLLNDQGDDGFITYEKVMFKITVLVWRFCIRSLACADQIGYWEPVVADAVVPIGELLGESTTVEGSWTWDAVTDYGLKVTRDTDMMVKSISCHQ